MPPYQWIKVNSDQQFPLEDDYFISLKNLLNHQPQQHKKIINLKTIKPTLTIYLFKQPLIFIHFILSLLISINPYYIGNIQAYYMPDPIEEIQQPLNYSLKESVQPIPVRRQPKQSQENNQPSIIEENNQQVKISRKRTKKYKIIGIICFIAAVICLILCLIVPGLIIEEIRRKAFNAVVFSPQNQQNWAHFPGKSGTKVIRNYTFFNFTNAEEVFLYDEKPKFRQIKDYKLLERQDYLQIQYLDDFKRVKFRDWLHFQQSNETRNLSEKVKIINVAKLGYWYQLKHSRQTVLLQQGLATTFSNLESSIYNIVIGQGINSQYLNDFTTVTLTLFIPSLIQPQNWNFLYYDIVYGIGGKNTVGTWVNAVFASKNGQFSSDALLLKDYFTLSDIQLTQMLSILRQFVGSIEGLILQNHYCTDFECTGRNLGIRQLASSYVTRNTPPVSTTDPTETICEANTTCDGKYPQLSSFYRNVYLKQHPKTNQSLVFDEETILSWFNHNLTKPGYQYNVEPNCLLHIGNLDSLWGNGTGYDKDKNTKFLRNIKNQFGLESEQHTLVFWEWLKYFKEAIVSQGGNNEYVGISTLFSQSLYKSFVSVQDYLQIFLLQSIILDNTKSMSCQSLLALSFDSSDAAILNNICEYYENKPQKYIKALIYACKNKYGPQWDKVKSLGASHLNMESLCDIEIEKGFGNLYDSARKYLNSFYECNETPNPYCSDYQLAVKQWTNSSVTRNPIPQIINQFKSTSSISHWFPSLTKPFQYFHYTTLYPNKSFPVISTYVGYILLNFNNWFSSSVVLRQFFHNSISPQLKNYMRYTIVFVAMDGFTIQKTAKQFMLGYKDEFLENIRTSYPPFGGDPSVNSIVMFNDPNITEEEAVTMVELATGVGNYSDLAQYKKWNGLSYLTVNKTKFDGTKVYSELESPWIGQDYFYGTNAKFFSPNQDIQNYVSIFIPNVQRYKGGQDYEDYQRFGLKLRIGYGTQQIFQSKYQNHKNEKYYQTYHGVFNQTSVTGIPLFMTKNHFLTCPSNWSTFVNIYNEDQSIHYQQTSKWDDSFFIYETYSGVSLQSVLFLQGNYYHEPDSLFTNQQTMLMPIFSVHRSGNMTQETANSKFSQLGPAISALKWTFYIFLSLAIATAILTLFTIYRLWRIRQKNKINKNKFKESVQNDKDKKDNLDKNMAISLQKLEQKNDDENVDFQKAIMLESQ